MIFGISYPTELLPFCDIITNFVPSLIALYRKEVDVEDLFAEWNMDAVLYCYKKQDKMLAEIEAMPDTFEQFL